MSRSQLPRQLGPAPSAQSLSVTLASDSPGLAVGGSVSISNFPVTQSVSGTVSVSNFPATQPVSGTVSVSNFPATQPVTTDQLPSLGAAIQSDSLPCVLANRLDINGPASLFALNANLLSGVVNEWTDVRNANSVSVMIRTSAGTGTPTVAFEQTNDPAGVGVGVIQMELLTSLTPTPLTSATLAASATVLYVGSIHCRYVRFRLSSAQSGGTIQAFASFSQLPYTRAVTTVHQPTAANMQVTTTGTATVTGNTAHSSSSTGNPVRVAGRVVTTSDTTLVNSDVSDLMMTSAGQAIVKSWSSAENDWFATNLTITGATFTTLRAAPGANLRNYLTTLQLQNVSASISTYQVLLDGTTEGFRVQLPASMTVPYCIKFDPPLRAQTANTAMTHASPNGNTNVWAQGYVSF